MNIFKIAEMFQKKLASDNANAERVGNLKSYIYKNTVKELNIMGASIAIGNITQNINKDGTYVAFTVDFYPKTYNKNNYIFFNKIGNKMQDILDMYYGQIKLEFYTDVHLVPKNIEKAKSGTVSHKPSTSGSTYL